MENLISVFFFKHGNKKQKENQDKSFPMRFDLPQQRYVCLDGDFFV